jgi:hypothetical protein
MKILAVKHIRQSGFNPFISLGALAFRAVPVTATVIRNMDFNAGVALFHVTAKRRRPEILQRIQYPFMIIQNSTL